MCTAAHWIPKIANEIGHVINELYRSDKLPKITQIITCDLYIYKVSYLPHRMIK